MKKTKEKMLTLLGLAKGNLQRDGRLRPVFLLENRMKGCEMILPDLSDDIKKQISFQIIKKQLESGAFISFTFITESWVKTTDKDEPNLKKLLKGEIKPRDCMDRKEAITIYYKDEEGTGFVLNNLFTRKEKEIIFEESYFLENTENTHIEGNIWNIWK